LIFDASVKNYPRSKPAKAAVELAANTVEKGKKIFAERACAACHAPGKNDTELLGPNLFGITARLTRDEILEEVMTPSKRIKPGMAGLKLVKKDGSVLLGRVMNSDEKQISIMLVGNAVVKIPKEEIAKTENHTKSLMYEGLLSDASEEEKKHLLDYLSSLTD